MATSPPTGYLNRKVAESVQEAMASYSVDNIKTIVKSAIQRYIQSFMDRDGGNRQIYESITKLGLQYITDKSFDQNSDQTLRKTQLARLFEQIHRELPAILIMDSEFNFIPSNFTGLERAYIQNGHWYGTLQIVRSLKVSVIVGTRDQTTTDFFHGMLSALFGELLFISGGTRITGNERLGETWVMGMGNPSLGNVTQQKVSEDPKDTIWMCVIDLNDIFFEDHITIKQPIDKFGQPPGPGALNEPDLADASLPIIYAPDTISINQTVKVLFALFQPDIHRVIVDNPNIGTFEPSANIFSPRRLGTCNIQVVRHKKPVPEIVNQQTGVFTEVIASKQIKITN